MRNDKLLQFSKKEVKTNKKTKNIMSRLSILKIGLKILAIAVASIMPTFAEAKVNVAVVMPQEGEYKVFGEQIINGAQTAVDLINEDGGLHGEEINLIKVNDPCEDGASVVVAKMLADNASDKDKISMVIGPYCTNKLGEINNIYAHSGIIQIIPVAIPKPQAGEQSPAGLIKLGGYKERQSEAFYQFYKKLFGGKQDLDVSTADHAVSAGADATQYGADITLSRTFMLSSAFDLEPSLGIFYTSIDMDDIRDNAGKTAAFEDMHYGEAELGLKLSYLFCRGGCSNRLYVKPSIIQTFGSGGKTVMTGIAGHSVYDDQTLGRVEIGGEFSFSRSFKSYLSAGHTFGDDYDAFDVNLGLNYLW